MIRVGLVGYGIIGKRVADAIERQPDMRCSGVAVRRPSARLVAARAKGVSLHSTPNADRQDFDRAGFVLHGDLDDLTSRSDVIVDCGPRGTGATRDAGYQSAPVNVVYCGGESHCITGFTFTTAVNFEEARGRKRVKVGSCNTTGLARLIAALMPLGPIERVDATLVRSVSDPDKAAKGFLGAEVVLGRSKHAADIEWLFPDVKVWTQAFAVPTNVGHAISLSIEGISPGAPVRDRLMATPRITVGDAEATARLGGERVISPMAGIRDDHPELLIWDESIRWDGDRLKVSGWVHSESITVPEMIDATRLLGGSTAPVAECAHRTDTALGGLRPLTDYVYSYRVRRPERRGVLA